MRARRVGKLLALVGRHAPAGAARNESCLLKARRWSSLLSLVCLLVFAAQVGNESAAFYFLRNAHGLPSVHSNAEPRHSTCLPSTTRADAAALALRQSGPASPDCRLRTPETRYVSTGPVVRGHTPLFHRPPRSLLRHRARLASRDDVPG